MRRTTRNSPSGSAVAPGWARSPGPRARASEMEHAIRHHINVHFDEDPVAYRRLSERLAEILAEHAGNWEQQALFLAELIFEDYRIPADHLII